MENTEVIIGGSPVNPADDGIADVFSGDIVIKDPPNSLLSYEERRAIMFSTFVELFE